MIVIIFMVVITLSIVLFPKLASVKTTGEYDYQSLVLEMTDTERTEDFDPAGGSRKLSVLVYYPDGNDVENNSCPLMVFSHGGISTKTSNLSLLKELASHGYVAVSIDHTYHALVTEIEGKKIFIDSGYMKELNTEDSHTEIENSYACYQRWMKLRTDDINFVIDTFIQKSAEERNSFYSLIDADCIGVAGHSLGGSAALGIARQRKDVKAAIALESPYMCDIMGINEKDFVWNTAPYPCAVMNFYSDSGYPLLETDHKYFQNRNMYKQDKVENYYIEGSNHFTLTDLVRTSPLLCAILGGGYRKSGYATLEFINQKSISFLDKILK